MRNDPKTADEGSCTVAVQIGRTARGSMAAGEKMRVFIIPRDAAGGIIRSPQPSDYFVTVSGPAGTQTTQPWTSLDPLDIFADPPRVLEWSEILTVRSPRTRPACRGCIMTVSGRLRHISGPL